MLLELTETPEQPNSRSTASEILYLINSVLKSHQYVSKVPQSTVYCDLHSLPSILSEASRTCLLEWLINTSNERSAVVRTGEATEAMMTLYW